MMEKYFSSFSLSLIIFFLLLLDFCVVVKSQIAPNVPYFLYNATKGPDQYRVTPEQVLYYPISNPKVAIVYEAQTPNIIVYPININFYPSVCIDNVQAFSCLLDSTQPAQCPGSVGRCGLPPAVQCQLNPQQIIYFTPVAAITYNVTFNSDHGIYRRWLAPTKGATSQNNGWPGWGGWGVGNGANSNVGSGYNGGSNVNNWNTNPGGNTMNSNWNWNTNNPNLNNNGNPNWNTNVPNLNNNGNPNWNANLPGNMNPQWNPQPNANGNPNSFWF